MDDLEKRTLEIMRKRREKEKPARNMKIALAIVLIILVFVLIFGFKAVRMIKHTFFGLVGLGVLLVCLYYFFKSKFGKKDG